MSEPIPAIYDSGVFRPLEPGNWPQGTRAEVKVLPIDNSAAGDSAWPAGYFEQTAGAFASEPFQRPPQGEHLQRDDW